MAVLQPFGSPVHGHLTLHKVRAHLDARGNRSELDGDAARIPSGEGRFLGLGMIALGRDLDSMDAGLEIEATRSAGAGLIAYLDGCARGGGMDLNCAGVATG